MIYEFKALMTNSELEGLGIQYEAEEAPLLVDLLEVVTCFPTGDNLESLDATHIVFTNGYQVTVEAEYTEVKQLVIEAKTAYCTNNKKFVSCTCENSQNGKKSNLEI